MIPPPMRTISVNDATFAYVEKGVGEPVVFVHGSISDLRTWLPQIESVSDSYRAISYSRRGHWPAQQVKDERPYTRSVHAEDLAGFLNALGLKEVHLVGHSFGATVALLTAVQFPQLVKSLILAEPCPIASLFDASTAGMIARQKMRFDEAHLLLKGKNWNGALRQFLTTMVGADILDQLPPAARVVTIDNAPTLAPMLEHYFAPPPISREQLRRLATPTLLISGEFSPNIAFRNNRLLQDCLQQAEIAVMQSVSHSLHVEDPTAFNDLLLNFLSNHPGMKYAGSKSSN